MTSTNHKIVSGNQAAAHMAYRLSEVFPIYPITPASGMSELVEQWNAQGKSNYFGSETSVATMQSEAGVAGALHGALQTGSMATTFTASQGLLLMAPNMFKMAGQLLPHVIHVATRSVATHALSVFGDHSDIMAVRNTGYGFLGASTVQEVQDFALISQLASLRSRIPFVHFFDGFRTSHEYNTIIPIFDDTLDSLVNTSDISDHRSRALNPNKPVLRGSAQGPDVFFQSREALNPIYNQCPNIVQEIMDEFGAYTGRKYRLFDYYGDAEAEHIIVSMASSTSTIEHALSVLNNEGGKFGMVNVRLFRPFSTAHLLQALPSSTRRITVLDRCKEPGAGGEPLYSDIFKAVFNNLHHFQTVPEIIAGRYGLSSKEFTPSMVESIYRNMETPNPKKEFTIGITDDITRLNLDVRPNGAFKLNVNQAIFFDRDGKRSCESFENLGRIISSGNNSYVQGYVETRYAKAKSAKPAHLRYSDSPINAPYLIEQADFIACSIEDLKEDPRIITKLSEGATLLLSGEMQTEQLIGNINSIILDQLHRTNCSLYHVNLKNLQRSYQVNSIEVSGFHACYLALQGELLEESKLYQLFLHINEIIISEYEAHGSRELRNQTDAGQDLISMLISGRGEEVPVSMLPVDGTFRTGTSEMNKSRGSEFIPNWDPDLCVQCGACSMACPQGALRIKAFKLEKEDHIPTQFRYTEALETDWADQSLKYAIQVNPDQCTACENCLDACPEDALVKIEKRGREETISNNWNFFQVLPEMDRTWIDVSKVSQQQLQEPLFKYADVVEGCGEAPYLKLLSQLFGDRAIIANATGASSIFGGALPTTPWSKNWEGRGPAWANSLYEDNAEFGLGFRLSIDQRMASARALLRSYNTPLGFQIIDGILSAKQSTEEEIHQQRVRIKKLKSILERDGSKLADAILQRIDDLIEKSVWIVGGDGWAYDIGSGGLEHVLSSGKNVNILVLDNEVYDNTGGQMSKATPYGASVAFAYGGKRSSKKDLGKIAMQFKDVYVASVAIGADQEQTLAAFNEAESFNGPSLIIAYSHSDSHGIDMKRPSRYHKALVNSGKWLLYRYDPRRKMSDKNPLVLDSPPPSLPLKDYMEMEGRFDKFITSQKRSNGEMLQMLQRSIDDRYDEFWSRADSVEAIHTMTGRKLMDLQRLN